MTNRNIRYSSRELREYYSSNRRKWEDLYASEQHVFAAVATENGLGDILDVGCACGGLGSALCERFPLGSYTGIDINQDAIDWAAAGCRLHAPSAFIAGDILEFSPGRRYDTVISLGCADWNMETGLIIRKCWDLVREGGTFIISLRLTNGEGVNDISRSYQFINFSGRDREPERANYVVFNFFDAPRMFRDLSPVPVLISGYGYGGNPSNTAVTPYSSLVFAVFAVTRRDDARKEQCRASLELPLELFL